MTAIDPPYPPPGAVAPPIAGASDPAAAATQTGMRRHLPAALARISDAAWARIGILGILALAGALYLWNLAVNGYGNEYYAAAALAGSQDWTAWLFGSLDAGNFITVDKPPASLWVMGLSVRLFGLSSWSVLAPQALMGMATVGVLYAAVRRSFGTPAGLLAALLMAFTPVAVLMFRFDNPDALLVLLMTLGAWALGRGLEQGRIRWAALAAVFLGFAFLTKELQGWLVLPAFALTWLIAAPGSFWRRIWGLVVSLVAVIVAGGWWVALAELWPASARPYIGGSETDSVLDRLLGYNGLARILGNEGPGGGGGGAAAGGGFGGGFGGEPGILRMFNESFGGQITWLLPMALLAIPIGLWLHRRAGRTHPAVGGYLLWGAWLVTTAAVFSFMSGIIHEYYTVALAPAIAALSAGVLVDLWRRRSSRVAMVALAGLIALTAWWASELLARTPDFLPGLGTTVLVGGLVAAAGLVLAALLPRLPGMPVLRAVALALGLLAIAAGPMAYAAETATTPASGSIVLAGPVDGGMGGFGGGGGGLSGGTTGGPTGRPDGTRPSGGPGTPGGSTGTGTTGRGGFVGPGGFGGGSGADASTIAYLVANQGDATWIVAVSGAQSAASIELSSGKPVMGMGGWSGDPTPTLDELKGYVADGQLRYVLASEGGRSGFGRSGDSSDVLTWVQSSCTAVTVEGSTATNLYDCSTAVAAG